MSNLSETLVGRTSELSSLDLALTEVERNGPSAVALVGEPGMGKTRLLGELSERADQRGDLVLSGSASELERELPFWVFIDALDEYLQGLEPRRLAALDEADFAQLGHVFPSFEAHAAGVGAGPKDKRFRTHRAVRRLFEVLAVPKPLVLVLDDVHWADAGTIELLGSLLRRPPAAAVLIGMGGLGAALLLLASALMPGRTLLPAAERREPDPSSAGRTGKLLDPA